MIIKKYFKYYNKKFIYPTSSIFSPINNHYYKINFDYISLHNRIVFLKSIKNYNYSIIFIPKKNSNLFLNLKINYPEKLNWVELELKGVNYWFCQYLSTILIDVGKSHFFFIQYTHKMFCTLLKKTRKILLISFNSSLGSSSGNFFWFKLKSVGPYKLKGFHFFNEFISLKEGKKPFK